MMRVGIRTILGQYLALRRPPITETHVGMIDTATSPADVAREAATQAAFMCTRQFGQAPEVCSTRPLPALLMAWPPPLAPYSVAVCCIDAHSTTPPPALAEQVLLRGRTDLYFPYIPNHLHSIMFELLKNSMQATVQHQARGRGGSEERRRKLSGRWGGG